MMTNNCSGLMIPENGGEAAKHRLLPLDTTCIRHREQDAAAALIGARVHYLDYAPRHYWDGCRKVSLGVDDAHPHPPGLARNPLILLACTEPEPVARLADQIASLEPDLVLTQTPHDRDPEHHAVAAMVWQAFVQRPDLRRSPLRFWTPSTASPGGLFDAHYDHIEDISDFYAKKVELCACHASQMTGRRREIVARRAAYWGQRIGVAFAEPFRTAHWDELL
jgi:LmbE family N-acetylglucosaminyl deacetylase